MLSSAIVPLALAASALANVFMTMPVSSTVYNAGQQANVTWQDDGQSPSLSDFGLATFAVYAGNANQQTLLQTIATSVDVSSTTSVSFTPVGTIGPNSGEYFIRVTSQTLKDSANPKYYVEAFSAKFTMAGMTGTFNSTIQAEINGQSTAPIGGPTSSSPSATGASGSMTMVATSTGTSTSTSAPSSSSNGAGKPVMATGLVAFFATLVGAALL